MTVRSAWAALSLVAVLSGCAAAPQVPEPAPEAAPALAQPAPAAPVAAVDPPVMDSPPIEPVTAMPSSAPAREPDPPVPPPPAVQPQPDPPPQAQPLQPREQVAVIPPPEPPVTLPPVITQIVVAEPTAEEREFTALLADLQRYNGLPADDVRREAQAMTQAVARSRNDSNRVRLAVLYTLSRQGTQDDQRALQLFDAVAKSNPASPALRQLAAVLSAQVAERLRAVRDEQARSEAAIQKLEALRAMERSLLRDRIRSGGGGGGAGSGGGN